MAEGVGLAGGSGLAGSGHAGSGHAGSGSAGLEPVRSDERIGLLDVLRGFALLGILVPNILTFAWPVDSSNHPVMPESPAKAVGLWVHDVFFMGKFMFLFSLLFGAGVIVWDQKTRPGPLTRGTGRWYARCGWLLLFGVLHGLVLWFGDILMTYALAGMAVVWWARRLPAWALVSGGVGVYLLPTGLFIVSAFFAPQGDTAATWGIPIEEQIAAYTGGYADAFAMRARQLLFMVVLIPFFVVPWATGLMLIGMGLARSGLLVGRWPWRRELALAVVGLALGLGGTIALRAWLSGMGQRGDFLWLGTSQLVGMPTGLGYAATLALLVRLGARARAVRVVTAGLANIGRMALSNYLSHSILCALIFYGYGLGLYNRVEFPELWLVIAGVWAFNLIFSALWLSRFRYGPFEWAWRSLTYTRFEPMLLERGREGGPERGAERGLGG